MIIVTRHYFVLDCTECMYYCGWQFLQKNWHQIQPHSTYFSIFSWGGMPPDPLGEEHALSVLHTLFEYSTNAWHYVRAKSLMSAQLSHWPVNLSVHVWKVISHTVGDAVWARNFDQGPRWSRTTVTECLGNVMHKVQLEEQPCLFWQRRANQLHTRIVPVNIDSNSDNNLDTNDRSVLNNPFPLHRSSWVRKLTCRWVPDP